MKRSHPAAESYSRLTELEPGTWKPMRKSRQLSPSLKLALVFAVMSMGILSVFFVASRVLVHRTEPGTAASPKPADTRIHQ
jgi:hypothetical protein